MGSPNFGPAFSMQQGQPFIQAASGTQEFRPLGQGMPPGQSQLPQFFQNSVSTHHDVPGLGGPGVQLSSFTFSTPSFGQPQNAMNVSSQFQHVSQMHIPITPIGGQHWVPSGIHSASTVTHVPQTGMQPVILASTNQAMSVNNVIQEASSDWQEYTASDGRRYFYNKRTKTSSWEKPLELMTPMERADASTVWKEFTTAEGKRYYYNTETKQSKWKIPDELKLAREQAEKETSTGSQSGMVPNADAPATVKSSALEQPLASVSTVNDGSVMIPRVASSPVAVMPHAPVANPGLDSTSVASGETGTSFPVSPTVNEAPIVLVTGSSSPKTNLKNSYSHAVANAVDGASVQDIKEAKKGMAVAGKVNTTQSEEKAMDAETFLYASKQEAKVAFTLLLESANVEADWSWEQAMRVIINDKRYGALKTLNERKQAFNEYLTEKKKLEAEERRLKQRKAKHEFIKMLEESNELTPSMRWSKAIALFEEDHRYKAVEDPGRREDLFRIYLVDLKKKERAKAQEEQHQNRLEYRHFLESCGLIKVDTQWRKVKNRLEEDERCRRLEKIDRLEIFQEYIRDLEKEEEEQRKLKKEQIKRAERKNRDEFHKMMEDHVVSGILTANTQWGDYFQKVKESLAYLAVASNTGGATAKDLFEDVIEELEKKYDEDKTRVKDVLKIKKVTVATTWTFADFKAAIQDEIICPPLSDFDLQLVFEDLLKKAKEKEKKEHKKHRRLANVFTELLCNIEEINASSTWDECRQFFEESPAYRSIGDESFTRATFEEYVTRLLEKENQSKHKQEEKAKEEKEEKDKDKSKERAKDESENDDMDKRKDKDREKKHRRRHQSGKDNASSDKDEREDSKKSRRHGSGHRKSRKHAYSPESDGESKHKRHKKDCQDISGKNGDHEELGEDGEIC